MIFIRSIPRHPSVFSTGRLEPASWRYWKKTENGSSHIMKWQTTHGFPPLTVFVQTFFFTVFPFVGSPLCTQPLFEVEICPSPCVLVVRSVKQCKIWRCSVEIMPRQNLGPLLKGLVSYIFSIKNHPPNKSRGGCSGFSGRHSQRWCQDACPSSCCVQLPETNFLILLIYILVGHLLPVGWELGTLLFFWGQTKILLSLFKSQNLEFWDCKSRGRWDVLNSKNAKTNPCFRSRPETSF